VRLDISLCQGESEIRASLIPFGKRTSHSLLTTQNFSDTESSSLRYAT
jgi:hypothetical protein